MFVSFHSGFTYRTYVSHFFPHLFRFNGIRQMRSQASAQLITSASYQQCRSFEEGYVFMQSAVRQGAYGTPRTADPSNSAACGFNSIAKAAFEFLHFTREYRISLMRSGDTDLPK